MQIDLCAAHGHPSVTARHMPNSVTTGPREVLCAHCRLFMLPIENWPDGGDPNKQPVTTCLGRVGSVWRCFVCWRDVLVTWRHAVTP